MGILLGLGLLVFEGDADSPSGEVLLIFGVTCRSLPLFCGLRLEEELEEDLVSLQIIPFVS